MKSNGVLRPFRLAAALALASVSFTGLGAQPSASGKGPAGTWQLAGTFQDQPARPPRSDVVTWEAAISEGSIRINQQYRHPEEGPSTYALSCSWTLSAPHGLDRLMPGEKIKATMTLSDASVPEKVSGWSHGYTGGNGGIRLTVGEARYPWNASGATAKEVLNVAVRHKETTSQAGEIVVPGGPASGPGLMAVRAVCGAAFERIYEWKAGSSAAAPPPPAAVPRKRPPKPLCPDALARLQRMAGAATGGSEPPPALTMDYEDIQKAFNGAIRKYADRAGKRPFVDDNVGGTLPALTWLFTEGGLNERISRQFVFTSDADRAGYAKGAPATTKRSRRGTEVHFYNSLYEAAMKQPGTKLDLQEIVYLALDQRDGNMKEAMLLAHNTFRALARYREGALGSTDLSLTGVAHAPDFLDAYIEPFLDPPPQGRDQNNGAMYHLFGTAYFELQARGAYGEALVAEWVGFGVGARAGARLGEAVQKLRGMLSSDPQLARPSSRTMYSNLANEAEQVYREYVNGSGSDPWKYCYNVFGAQIGSWLYQDRLLRRGLPGVDRALGTLRGALGGVVSPGLAISASPLDIRWSGGGRSMTLDQAANTLVGEFPVRVMPYYEEENRTWGMVWSDLSGDPYDLTLEATSTGWAHFTRTDPASDDVFVYALPLAPGKVFRLAVRPGAVGAPMRSDSGESIVPVRLAASARGAGPARPDAPPASPRANLALGRPARQSRLDYGGDPSRAVDGNTGGDYMKGSVTHTRSESKPWWQVDLGSVRFVDQVVLWNRTDCCDERLGDFDVLVSELPFPADDLASARDGRKVWSQHVSGRAGRRTDVQVGRPGRFVRVQLSGVDHLSLAEVEVLGAGPD